MVHCLLDTIYTAVGHLNILHIAGINRCGLSGKQFDNVYPKNLLDVHTLF